MARTFSLQPLLNLARQRNEAAIKKLGMLNRNRQTAQGKLEMLQQYRKDYLDKMQQAEQGGMSPHELLNFREFIYRLDEAIRHQHGVIEQAQTYVSQGQSELTETRRRMKSYDTLHQRHIITERHRESKLEQKAQDEHSSRQAAYNKVNLDDSD
jgi:flagellar protein FliJ